MPTWLTIIICAILGFIAGIFIADRAFLWHRVNTNQVTGFILYLYAAIPAAILGAILGAFLPTLSHAVATIALLTLLSYFAFQIGGHVPPRIGLSTLNAVVEVRLAQPVRNPRPSLALYSGTASTLSTPQVTSRLESGRQIFLGYLYLFTARDSEIQLQLKDRPTLRFAFPKALPTDWTPWTTVAPDVEFRYRVEPYDKFRWDQERADRATTESFNSLTPASPIAAWLPMLASQHFDISNKAWKVLTARREEILPFLTSEDPELRRLAFLATARVNDLSIAYEPVLLAALDELIAELKQFEDSTQAYKLRNRFIDIVDSWAHTPRSTPGFKPRLAEVARLASAFKGEDYELIRDMARVAREAQ